MNDAEVAQALALVNDALDAWFRGEASEFDTLAKIAQVIDE